MFWGPDLDLALRTYDLFYMTFVPPRWLLTQLRQFKFQECIEIPYVLTVFCQLLLWHTILPYKDCPTFPCMVQNCSKIPLINVDECVKSTCWTTPSPGPGPGPRYDLVVGSIISFLAIFTIVMLILLRNKLKMYILRSLLNKQATLSKQGGIFLKNS